MVEDLNVSDECDILYVFEKDYRSKLASKSFATRNGSLVEQSKSAGENILRTSFEIAVTASVAIAYSPLVAFNYYNSHAKYISMQGGNTFWIPFGPFLWYLRLSAEGKKDYKGWSREQFENEMMKIKNFRASVLSFIFGDDDPNQGLEENRWKLIGEYITAHDGVITSEELAPYLDLKPTEQPGDDSYMLPVLSMFDGQPEVNDEGVIFYRFPSLQHSTSSRTKWGDCVGGIAKFLKENRWEFSKTNALERCLIVGLGALNLLAVTKLGTLLKSTAVTQIGVIIPAFFQFCKGGVSTTITPAGLISSLFLQVLMSALHIYAASYFAIPFLRWFMVVERNKEIERRNLARELSVRALEQPSPSLKLKLSSARDMAQRKSIGQDRIIYSKENDIFEKESETEKWDRIFMESEKRVIALYSLLAIDIFKGRRKIPLEQGESSSPGVLFESRQSQ